MLLGGGGRGAQPCLRGPKALGWGQLGTAGISETPKSSRLGKIPGEGEQQPRVGRGGRDIPSCPLQHGHLRAPPRIQPGIRRDIRTPSRAAGIPEHLSALGWTQLAGDTRLSCPQNRAPGGVLQQGSAATSPPAPAFCPSVQPQVTPSSFGHHPSRKPIKQSCWGPAASYGVPGVGGQVRSHPWFSSLSSFSFPGLDPPAPAGGGNLPPWGLKRCSPATNWGFTLSPWRAPWCTAPAGSSKHPEVTVPIASPHPRGPWEGGWMSLAAADPWLQLLQRTAWESFGRDQNGFLPFLPGCPLVPVPVRGSGQEAVTALQTVPKTCNHPGWLPDVLPGSPSKSPGITLSPGICTAQRLCWKATP